MANTKPKHTIETLQKKAHANIIIIEKEYKTGMKALQCECRVCGKSLLMKPYQLARGVVGCNECILKQKLTALQDKLINDGIKIEFVNGYQNFKSKVKCECIECGNTWESIWNNLKVSNKVSCMKCHYKKLADIRRTPCKKLDKSNLNPNINIDFSTYQGWTSRLQCECRVCGDKWQSTFINLSRGTGCKRCGYKKISENKKLSFETIKNRYMQINPNITLLSSQYVSALSKMKWECNICHHIFDKRYNEIQQKRGCPKCSKESMKEKMRYNLDKVKILCKEINKNVEIIDEVYINAHTPIKCKCLRCDREYKTKWNYIQSGWGVCPSCSKHTSQVEADFLSHFTGWEKNRQILKGKELDAYFPSQRVAIEINGAYWHTDNQGKDRGYHLSKTKECEEQNVKLYHFFDSEILDKQDICVSMINKSIGKSKRIFARQCETREISPKQAKTFCIENHIQGYCVDKVRYGLFYKDELMSVMTFGKSRYNKQYEWELLRFCSKVGYIIVGGASKLLKHFERNISPKSLISYGNRRWCHKEKNVYDTIGFKYKGETLPNYFYERAGLMYSRQTFQRHKLNELFGYDFNEVLTESEIMSFYGFYRVYDCGNLVYTKEYINGC